MFGIGMPEMVIILAICFLFFGTKRLPEIGKSIGKTIKEFKKSIKEINSDIEENVEINEKSNKN